MPNPRGCNQYLHQPGCAHSGGLDPLDRPAHASSPGIDGLIAREQAIEDLAEAWVSTLPASLQWLAREGGLSRASERWGFDHADVRHLILTDLDVLAAPFALPPAPRPPVGAHGHVRAVRLRPPPAGQPFNPVQCLTLRWSDLPRSDRPAVRAARRAYRDDLIGWIGLLLDAVAMRLHAIRSIPARRSPAPPHT